MWDIYRSDCSILVRSEKDTKAPVPIRYKEHQSYHEGKIIVDKVINSLCWHPFWTGIAIVAYTKHAKNEYLIGRKTYDEVRRQFRLPFRERNLQKQVEDLIISLRLITLRCVIFYRKRVVLPIDY